MTFTNAQTLQIVWFVQDAASRRAGAIYEKMTGVLADAEQTNRNFQQGPFFSLATGERDGASYRALVSPGRVDFFVNALIVPGTLGTLTDTSRRMATLFADAKKLAAEIGNAVRIAFVVKYGDQAQSMEAASAAINTLIGNIAPMPGATDILFQVNRARFAKSEADWQYNRLLRWAAEGVQQLSMQVDIAGQGMQQLGPQLFASTYQIDISTIPRSSELMSPTIQGSLLGEIEEEVERLRAACSPSALAI